MATEYKDDVFVCYSRKDYVDETTKEIIPGNVISINKNTFDDNGITLEKYKSIQKYGAR